MSLSFDLNLSGGLNRPPQKPYLEEIQDVTVIGAGPAGLSAAIYAKRKGLKTLVIATRVGGQVLDTSAIENYPGFSSISGEELAKQFRNHAGSLGIPMEQQKEVAGITGGESVKTVSLKDGSKIRSRSVIIATGSHHKQLGVPGEGRLKGRGVAYCAICDGPLFQDRTVIVAGGGNAAVEAVIDLSKIAQKVILVHRSQLRADDILVKRMNQLNNVEVHLETPIQEILGDKMVEGVRVIQKATGKENVIKGDGVFVEIGYQSNTKVFEGFLDMNDKNELIVDNQLQTSIPGVFAAGDVIEGPYKQVVISAGDGAKAALAANDYINHIQSGEENKNANIN
ncbi:MAG: FAD-binding protein [Tindallia sp. MSAO_Bac2]|nr:MAG: FAD-binding protein [Tindallia sp. MSAO_Bac2]